MASSPSRGGWKRPDPAASGAVGGGLKEPGWAPGSSQPANSEWNPVKARQTPAYVPQQFNQPSPQYHPQQQQKYNTSPAPNHQNHFVVNKPPPQRYQEAPPHIQEPETPAWVGSLKSSSVTKPWEMHAATALTGEKRNFPYTIII